MRTFFRVWLGIGLIALGFGIGIVILAFASGDSWRDIPTYSINESYDGVSSINFDINYGQVKVEEGDTFSISSDNIYNDRFESYVSDGTWYIKEDFEDLVDLFGFRFSLRQMIQWNHDFSPRITITIPKDFVADSYRLKVGAGEVTVDSINASSGEFTVDAGKLQINQLTVDNESKYNVGTGEMVLNNVLIKDTTIDCGIGNVEIDGTITGDNNIDCGIGHIQMDIDGNEDDYNYEVSSDIGNVVIDDRSYHDRSINHDADNNLNLDCGIGNITIEFH